MPDNKQGNEEKEKKRPPMIQRDRVSQSLLPTSLFEHKLVVLPDPCITAFGFGHSIGMARTIEMNLYSADISQRFHSQLRVIETKPTTLRVIAPTRKALSPTAAEGPPTRESMKNEEREGARRAGEEGWGRLPTCPKTLNCPLAPKPQLPLGPTYSLATCF